MRITQFAPNHTQVHLPNGTCVLVSYDTTVAMIYATHPAHKHPTATKTSEVHSRTTTKYIKKFLETIPECNIIEAPQALLDAILC